MSESPSLLPAGLAAALARRCPTAPFGPSGVSALSCFELGSDRGRQIWVVACDDRFRVAGVALRFRSGRRGEARRRERLSPMEMAALEVLSEGCWQLVNCSHEEAMRRLAVHCRSGGLRLDALGRAARFDPLPLRKRLMDLRSFLEERSEDAM